MSLAYALKEHIGGETVFICLIGIVARFAPECASPNTIESSNCRFPPIIFNFLLNYQRPVAIVRTTQHSTVEAVFLVAEKRNNMRVNGQHWFGTVVWRPSDGRRTQRGRAGRLNKLCVFENGPFFIFQPWPILQGWNLQKGPPREAETQRQSDTETPRHKGTDT